MIENNGLVALTDEAENSEMEIEIVRNGDRFGSLNITFDGDTLDIDVLGVNEGHVDSLQVNAEDFAL